MSTSRDLTMFTSRRFQTPLPSVTNLQVDSVTFPPSVVSPASFSPASSDPLFLCGAGVQGSYIQGNFVISTVIGVYLHPDAVTVLTCGGWGCKTTEELTESVPFFRKIVTGSFEKFIKVTMKLPLTGQQYSEKVIENCVAIWRSLGINYSVPDTLRSPGEKIRFNKITKTFGAHGKERHYTRDEAVTRFLEIFKYKKFLPGDSILFALSRQGSLTIAFSKDDSIPKTSKTVIENRFLAEAVLESIIGKNGVSPGVRLSVAERLAPLMKNHQQSIPRT